LDFAVRALSSAGVIFAAGFGAAGLTSLISLLISLFTSLLTSTRESDALLGVVGMDPIFPKFSRPAGVATAAPAVVLEVRAAEAGVPFVLVVAMFFRSVGWGCPVGAAVMLSLLTSWLFACFPRLPAQGRCLFRWVFGVW
jgi:hypothetical protein